MSLINLKKLFFYYDYDDLNRAYVGTASTLVAALICFFFHLPELMSLWLITSAALARLMACGHTYKSQSLNYLIMAIVSSVLSFVVLTASQFVPLYGVYGLATMLVIVVMILPRYWHAMFFASVLSAIFIILAATISNSVVILPIHIWELSAAVFLGVLICMLVSLVFPLDEITYIEIDRSSVVIKRSIRVGLSIGCGFIIATYFNLQHPSWLVFTILAVSRMNFGASVRRCGYRLGGTFLGILIAVPLANHVFMRWPETEWFALLGLFLFYLMSARHYAWSVFFLTTLLGVVYFLYFPQGGNANAFMIDRLIETLVGVLISIIAEIIVFPRSVISDIKQKMIIFWEGYNTCLSAMLSNDKSLMVVSSSRQNLRLKAINQLVYDFRYEPFRSITKHYYNLCIFVRILEQLQQCLFVLMTEGREALVGEEDVIESIIHIIELLKRQYNYPLEERRVYLQELLVKIRMLRKNSRKFEHESLRKLLACLLFLIRSYHKLLSSSSWEMHWFSKRSH